MILSHEVAVIQWITSCLKSYDHMCNNILAQKSNVIDKDRVISCICKPSPEMEMAYIQALCLLSEPVSL